MMAATHMFRGGADAMSTTPQLGRRAYVATRLLALRGGTWFPALPRIVPRTGSAGTGTLIRAWT